MAREVSTLAAFHGIRLICFMSRFLASIYVESQTVVLLCLNPTLAGVGSSLPVAAHRTCTPRNLTLGPIWSTLAVLRKLKRTGSASINMQNQNSAQPATANLEVVMVAQRLGGFTSTALAVPGDVPIGTMGGDNSAEEFDRSFSPPGKAEAKKVEPETKRPRVPPRMQTERAASK